MPQPQPIAIKLAPDMAGRQPTGTNSWWKIVSAVEANAINVTTPIMLKAAVDQWGTKAIGTRHKPIPNADRPCSPAD